MPNLKGLEERNFYHYYTRMMEGLWQPMFLFMALGIQANYWKLPQHLFVLQVMRSSSQRWRAIAQAI